MRWMERCQGQGVAGQGTRWSGVDATKGVGVGQCIAGHQSHNSKHAHRTARARGGGGGGDCSSPFSRPPTPHCWWLP